jgi:tetratricopeptide (TPR) repeat protein
MSEYELGSPEDTNGHDNHEDELLAKQKALADSKKDEGNQLLANHKYALAVEKYTEAIALFPTAIYYSNRAQALIKLESFAYAVQDANEAIK